MQKELLELKGEERLRIKAIIDQYGWPGVSLVGLEGEKAFCLLVKYQDDDVPFQKQCLELLKKAVEEYEAPTESLALLINFPIQ